MHDYPAGSLRWNNSECRNQIQNQIIVWGLPEWVLWLVVVNETDGQCRLLTLDCSWSKSWFLIKLIVCQRTLSCFWGRRERGQAVLPPGYSNTWPHGKAASWSVLKWQNIRGLVQILTYFVAKEVCLLLDGYQSSSFIRKVIVGEPLLLIFMRILSNI